MLREIVMVLPRSHNATRTDSEFNVELDISPLRGLHRSLDSTVLEGPRDDPSQSKILLILYYNDR